MAGLLIQATPTTYVKLGFGLQVSCQCMSVVMRNSTSSTVIGFGTIQRIKIHNGAVRNLSHFHILDLKTSHL